MEHFVTNRLESLRGGKPLLNLDLRDAIPQEETTNGVTGIQEVVNFESTDLRTGSCSILGFDAPDTLRKTG
jgi:hypothetical protein